MTDTPSRPPATPPGTRGRLLLVPNTLDLGCEPEVPLADVLPQAVITTAAGLGHWVAENAKTTRALLKRIGAQVPLALPLQQVQIAELPRPPKGAPRGPTTAEGDAAAWTSLLAPALAGHDLGLISEAGLPAVADPGARLVQAAHEAGVAVVPLAGPSALLLALAASGLNGQSFAFVGYLPQDAAERAARIKALEATSRQQRQTQIAIETPYRNDALLAALVQTLQPGTRLSVASGLSLPQQQCRTLGVAAWRKLPALPSNRLPSVYCWLAA